ncbi:uncharacterized protein PgNI_12038 [Pyricularia grisea]|uniref:Alpha-galactosidase n=1 Tax=Pyricularia grisea TaxID=148305 RepID=A0A6P8AQH3_PYRGI|nr:uncharacterized protein PgNI_12038 [Pyricularia grisea]TLD04320.1 hypothetical protein PgNI_12038 [Pyricularia grisea]
MVAKTVAIASTAIFALVSASPVEKRLENGLGRTPALGWNSWNVAQCDAATEAFALDTANRFISMGLKDLGYTYVNIDDCWSTMERNSSGYLVADPKKWPRGIKPVVDEIHAKGLKFGLYGSAGTKTCAGYPASQGYQRKDAELLAEWGVDYWKHDNCYTPCRQGLPMTCPEDQVIGNTRTWYGTMRDAILATEKPIFFSLCNWGRDRVWEWGKDYGNSWRMSIDIWNDWASVIRIGSAAAGLAQYAAPGGFNDLDMMQISNGALNPAQERTHMGIWAIVKSPIILGTDLSKISDSSLAIIKNKDLIAINQDKLGKAATYFQPPGEPAPVDGELYPYWAGQLSDGVVIGLTNAMGTGPQTLAVDFEDVPGLGAGTWSWTEVYSGKTGTGTGVSFDLERYDMAVIKVTEPQTGRMVNQANGALWSSRYA